LTHSALHSSGYASDDEFFSKLSKQGAYLGNNIGVMCTAGGKWLGDKNIQKALAAWNRLPTSQRLPGAVKIEDHGPFDSKRGVEPPAGALIVRVYTRSLAKDSRSQFFAPAKIKLLGSGATVNSEPNRDFLWLTDTEWQALVPQEATKGEKVEVPESVRRRIFRFHLRDNSFCLGGIWTPEQIRSGQMKLSVEAVSPKSVRLRLEGAANLGNSGTGKSNVHYDLALCGVLEYNRERNAFDRFDVVALGEYWGFITDTVNGAKPGPYLYPLGVAFELARGSSSADRVPPRGTRLTSGSSASAKHYFQGAPGTIRAAADSIR